MRGSRYNGKARILRRMQVGILSSLELEDASPVSAALLAIHKWVERIAEHEMERITAKCERYSARGQQIPAWVWRGTDEGFRRVEQVEHRVQMLLGIFGAHGVLPLEFKPVHSVGDLLVQHLDDLGRKPTRRVVYSRCSRITLSRSTRSTFAVLPESPSTCRPVQARSARECLAQSRPAVTMRRG